MKRPLIQHASTVARINVTPIIDVALVLVIILLITAPMISVSDMKVNLPEARTRSVEDNARLSVTLGERGELAIDDQQVTLRQFAAVLALRIHESGDEDMLVVVRADATASHGLVRDIIKETRRAGAKRIAIAARQRGKER